MPVDFLATEPHYSAHLAGIWDALPPDLRGTFHLTVNGRHLDPSPNPTVVAAISDGQRATGRPLALVEHGAGQTYGDGTNPGYPGGLRRERFSLFVCPSKRVADLNAARYPDAMTAVVGTPAYLDAYLPARTWHQPHDPVVAVSFHQHLDTPGAEGMARNAWHEYAEVSDHLTAVGERWSTLGHGHPRWYSADVETSYRSFGIEPTPRWLDVVDRADCYVIDNSSTGWEWAALGRPLVWLNPKHYRRDLHHGLRFWTHAEVGVQCDRPEHLADCVALALDEHPLRADRQAQLIADVYAYRDGRSAQRAADAIADWAERVG